MRAEPDVKVLHQNALEYMQELVSGTATAVQFDSASNRTVTSPCLSQTFTFARRSMLAHVS